PATSAGTPGSVTPISRCGSDGTAGSGHSIDARYQVFGTRMERCISLATSACPSDASEPVTAQLLLPIASRSATPESQIPIVKSQGAVQPLIAATGGSREFGAANPTCGGRSGNRNDGVPARRVRRL